MDKKRIYKKDKKEIGIDSIAEKEGSFNTALEEGKREIEDSKPEEEKIVDEDKKEIGIDSIAEKEGSFNTALEEGKGEIEDSKPEEEKIVDEDIKKIQERQIKLALILMGIVILLIVIVPLIKNNFIDKFYYKGLIFQKTQLGDLFFYSTRFPVVGISGQVIGDYALNFRNDPRKLDYIPVNTSEGKIEFALDRNKYGEVYISLNPFMEVCDDSAIALLTISGFLRDSGLEVKSAVTDKAYAKAHNINQRWCHDSGFDTVIIYTDGNKTSINEIYENCYEVSFNNCEVMQASEKFILVILEDYTKKFKTAQ